MRKKTIKYYFFNSIVKNPGVHYLFCFSKRAFRQNKQQAQAKKLYLSRKKKQIKYLNQFKNHIYYSVKLNQWNKNYNKIILFFLKSYYNTYKVRSKIYKKKKKVNKRLLFWFHFKNYFYRQLFIKLKKFHKIGILSSQYVHIMSYKNLTYHIRSKYRPKTVRSNFFNYYFYMCSKLIYIYLYNLNSFIYFFSSNHANKSIWFDSDFYIKTSNWYNNTLNLKKKPFISITNRNKFFMISNFTTENYNNNDIIKLFNNRYLINSFFLEEDPLKKDEKFKEILENIQTNNINYIHTINFYILSYFYNEYTKNLNQHINKYVYIYTYLYINLK